MDWGRDGSDWPNGAHSRFIASPPHRWHVQEDGNGPTVLLLHGAGGATQSWRSLFPLLARSCHVVAPDLPGQGFSKIGSRMRLGLRPMAEDLAALCGAEGWSPDLIVGHSAGGVLALELSRHLRPGGIVGINAALGTFEGLAGWLFPVLAKFMAINPLIPPLLARMAGGDARVAELLASTGSEVSQDAIRFYGRLMRDRAHIDGTLAMMSQWNIEPLLARLDAIHLPVTLIAATGDETVPPAVSERAAARLPRGRFVPVPDRGHLLHEEDAPVVADLVLEALRAASTAPAATG